jgi:hypothetical protein
MRAYSVVISLTDIVLVAPRLSALLVDAASVATNPHAYATPTAFYERKTSNPTYTSAYASRMKLISLMHGTGWRRVPLKSRGKSLTLNLLTVC